MEAERGEIGGSGGLLWVFGPVACRREGGHTKIQTSAFVSILVSVGCFAGGEGADLVFCADVAVEVEGAAVLWAVGAFGGEAAVFAVAEDAGQTALTVCVFGAGFAAEGFDASAERQHQPNQPEHPLELAWCHHGFLAVCLVLRVCP